MVTFYNVPVNNDEPMWDYAAQVEILEKSGEPLCVIYGCGEGAAFYGRCPSYNEALKNGIKEEYKIGYVSLKDLIQKITKRYEMPMN